MKVQVTLVESNSTISNKNAAVEGQENESSAVASK